MIAASDYVSALPDLIRTWVPRSYVTLGTDGFGRSDTRAQLRRFFEVDRHHIAASLRALADKGSVEISTVTAAIQKYGVDSEAESPWATRVMRRALTAPDTA